MTYFPDPTANPFKDAWVDTKTPGGRPRLDFPGGGFSPDERRTYCVGTTQVNTTQPFPVEWTGAGGAVVWTVPPASFSGSPASPSGVQGFSVPQLTDRRQVVILQCNRTDRGTNDVGAPDANGIVWQRYIYGETGGGEDSDFSQPTNARAVSVWAEPALASLGDVNTRIAICGEAWDQVLPLSQNVGGLLSGPQIPGGFISVYDGLGTLKWTHHFIAPGSPCAVTDVAVRVDSMGRDVVTYCGITKNGDPGTLSALHPILPFLAPDSGLPAPAPGSGLSGGATLQPVGGWDGFVGRLIITYNAQGQPQRNQVFHSTAGGPGQDGLFGLAEISPDRFVVVGSTEAEPGEEGFPIAFSGAGLLTSPYQVGVAMVFNASLTEQLNPSNLILEQGIALGGTSFGTATLARDVAIGFDVAFERDNGSGAIGVFEADAIYVVGSTNDGSFAPTNYPLVQTWLAVPSALQGGQFGGLVDGFAAVIHSEVGVGLWPQTFAYWGGVGADGLSGVSCWGEFSEHFVVSGFSSPNVGSADIGVTTFLLDNAFGPNVPGGSVATPSNSGRIRRIRDDVIGGSSDDRPAVVGMANATDDIAGVVKDGQFSTFFLDQGASGGGVSVTNDGRVTVVGRTFPVGGGYPVAGAGARSFDSGADAVRTDVDMLPRSSIPQVPPTPPIFLDGIGRTDGTGWQGVAPSSPVFPIPGYSGGTTPMCGLDPYGRRVGRIPPPVSRMLIDYEGTPPAQGVNDAAIIVSRPAVVSGSLDIGVLWFGFPQTAAPIVDGVEFWADTSSWVFVFNCWPEKRAYRMPLATLPAGVSGTVSVQLHCLLNSALGSGTFGFTPVTHGPGCASEFVASPALWFSF